MSSLSDLFLQHFINTKGLSDEEHEDLCGVINHYTQVYLKNQYSPDKLTQLEDAFVLALQAVDKRAN